MKSALRTMFAIDFAQPICSPSTTCATICGYLQHARKDQGLTNAEDLGSYAAEKRM